MQAEQASLVTSSSFMQSEKNFGLLTMDYFFSGGHIGTCGAHCTPAVAPALSHLSATSAHTLWLMHGASGGAFVPPCGLQLA